MDEDYGKTYGIEKLAELLIEWGIEFFVKDEVSLAFKDGVGNWHECWMAGADESHVNALIVVTPEQLLSVPDLNGIITENKKLRDQCGWLLDKTLEMADENARLKELLAESEHSESMAWDRIRKAETDNAKLREQVERLQPKDCEGNVLDIADTVSMLRSEYDGDHEWDDVVVELVLTKWGGDRWIVRGSKGEAWTCECSKTGYDEDAYEGSDDVEPIANPTLMEAENAKLRELAKDMLSELRAATQYDAGGGQGAVHEFVDRMRELGVEV